MTLKKKVYGTSRGHVIDDTAIEQLAAEAETGYEPAVVRGPGDRPTIGSGPGEVVPVRLDRELKPAVEQRAEHDHTSTSEIIREALRRFHEVA